jgi:hypothetical protein
VSDARLYRPRQTQDVEIGSDCSFAKSTAFTSDYYGSLGYAIKNGGSVSQQVWHIKELSLLKAVSAKHRSKFAALSPVMMATARQLKIVRAAQNNQQTNNGHFNKKWVILDVSP